MKNKLLALIAIGLILIGGIIYSPQPSSQALAQERTEIIPVGPGVGARGRVQQIDKGIAVQFECQARSSYNFYNIFLDNKNVGQLQESAGSLSDPIPLPVGKKVHLFTFQDGGSDEEVDRVLVKVK